MRTPLPASVTPFQLKVVPLTLEVMSTQAPPSSSEPNTRSPAASPPLRTPLMVCAETLVTKSVEEAPVSLERDRLLTLAGATVSYS